MANACAGHLLVSNEKLAQELKIQIAKDASFAKVSEEERDLPTR